MNKNQPIGVFDSGVGGISVLKEMTVLLPQEDFLFYGDSLHAPYGEKTEDEIFTLAHSAIQHLMSQNVKAIVIACNTATSVAISRLREKYPEMIFIGMEPAIKPAVSEDHHNRVLVMATPTTLRLEKYDHLSKQLENKADFIAVECPGLAGRIEQGNLLAPDLHQLLLSFLKPYIGKVDNVVLGCTHYPFIRDQIRTILGNIPFFDGSHGTAMQLLHVLEEKSLLQDTAHRGSITFTSSKNTPEEIDLYKSFYAS